MVKFLKGIWIRLCVLFVRPALAQPALTASPARKRRPKLADEELGQSFYFRRTILDQLETYFRYLARMRAADPESYALYRRIGGFVLPDHAVADINELSPWFVKTLPSFGAVSFASGDDDDKTVPLRFLYFRKYETKGVPPTVERTNIAHSAVYVTTVLWDTGKRREFVVQECPFAIGADGSVSVLRTRYFERQIVRHKHGQDKGHETVIKHQRWGIHPEIIRLAREAKPQDSPTDFMRREFCLAANFFEASNAGIVHVGVTKGNLLAKFSVDVTRTPYFFRDRDDDVVTESGSRKRIFHIVKSHTRRSGRHVKAHFRGLREFSWNGYSIRITVPGRDHPAHYEFDAGAVDADLIEDKDLRAYIGMDVLGKAMAEAERNATRH